MSETTTIQTKGLDQLLKALKAKPPIARIGILGSTSLRSKTADKPLTNAEVGAAHEFGVGVLRRSFLRVPISENLEKKMNASHALDKDVLDQVVKSGSVIPWLRKVAVLAEGIVIEAFATGGFGKWPAWKTPGYSNNTGQILVDTQQLRNSITHEVKE